MSGIRSLAAATLLCLTAAPIAAQEEPPVCPEARPPYVFILMDTSGSLNLSSRCTQDQLDLGECQTLCPTGDCFVPLQGDDPSSKLYLLKQGLQAALAAEDLTPGDIRFGFASFNQDQLKARGKHWIYQAQSVIPFLNGVQYPVPGAREVFGLLWGCDTGSNDNEIGCSGLKPADLNDPWEVARVQRLPKGGAQFTQSAVFYIRQPSGTHRITYTPFGGGVLGNPTLQVTVKIDRCSSPSCTSILSSIQQVVTWSLVDEFLSWDNADSVNPSRTNPALSYFGQGNAADASATSTCTGWDPNTDSSLDTVNNYNLRWPTDSSDPRGTYFRVGDVIPMDWLDDHNADIQERLAPNLVSNPLAVPDFSIAPYLRDLPLGVQTFLRLEDENLRPLVAVGSTPIGNSLKSFRTWYAGCPQGVCSPTAGWQGVAAANDPDWLCRKKFLVLLTDADDNCSVDPCAMATALYEQQGIATFVAGFGSDPASSPQLECIAAEGGTGSPLRPQTLQELIVALADIFAAAKQP
jgi:hypothetical protein